MRIRQLETFIPSFQPNLCVLRLTADDGEVGLGETFFHAATVETYLHETLAPLLFELDDATPAAAAEALTPYAGFQGTGIENRTKGAIDVALWDLLGRLTGRPVVELLGGPVVGRSIPVYNTCAGPGYVGSTSQQTSANWGAVAGDLEDLHAFMTRPGKLAQELVTEGYPAMKIWPFDLAAERTHGTSISRDDLAAGLAVLDDIRNTVGNDIGIMVELHGLWDTTTACQLVRELERFEPRWVEDPVRADVVNGLARVTATTHLPIAAGETVAGVRGFLPLFAADAVDVVTVDLQWTGGLSEARAIAALAHAHGLPLAPHDCTGPITLAASAHLVLSQPNGQVQETARAFLRTWYRDVVAGLPVVTNGHLTLPDRPGLGVELRAGFETDPRVARRSSSAWGRSR